MRIVTPAEAVAGIRSGDQIFIQAEAATPSELLDALVARAPELADVKIVHLHAEGPAPHLAPEMEGHFLHRALFIGPNARRAVNEGRAEYVPVFLSDVPQLFTRGLMPLDAVFINVTPPDAHGFCSLGTSVDATLAAVRAARTVIAEINSAMPRTLGSSFLHQSEIDLAIEVHRPPYVHDTGTPGEIEQRIAGFVADLIPDGATLQMGIGAIPSAVGDGPPRQAGPGRAHRDVHRRGGRPGRGGRDHGRRKELDRGKLVATFVMGTQRLYDFVNDNPMVEMRQVEYTNDTAVIRRFRRMCAINSAIEVDLTGQVCADSIGWRLYSGVGGQMDFIRGAALAEEGRAIIALPSTTSDGRTSRIVCTLKEGAGVVTTRAHVQTIVTEFGVAELHGRSVAERARALTAIAHPDFREDLDCMAHRRRFL